MESRTQGLRPRTQKKSEAKDRLSEDRPSRGKGQECSRPRAQELRTQHANVLQKKSSRTKIANFRRSPKKRSLRRKSQIFREISDEEKTGHGLGPFFTNQKIVLSSVEDRVFSRTWRLGFEAKDFKICPRGPHLCELWTNHCFRILKKKKYFSTM